MPSWRVWEWRFSSTILDFVTRLRWVVGFTPRPLYSCGIRPRYPLDRKLDESQSRSRPWGEENNLAFAGNWTLAVQPVARRYTTELSVLLLLKGINTFVGVSLQMFSLKVIKGLYLTQCLLTSGFEKISNTTLFINAQNYWVFGLFPSSGVLGSRNMTFRKLDLFLSSGERGRRHLLSWDPYWPRDWD
jgi:hypothetical protein